MYGTSTHSLDLAPMIPKPVAPTLDQPSITMTTDVLPVCTDPHGPPRLKVQKYFLSQYESQSQYSTLESDIEL